MWKKTGRGCAQRGLAGNQNAGNQNGGRMQRDGGLQNRTAHGREGQTFTMMLHGEEHGGVARAGRQHKRDPRA